MSTPAVARMFWRKVQEDVKAIRVLGSAYPGTVSNRSYYAVFHAVCAHFALEGLEFPRHEAVRAAVHRDLVRPGTWPIEWGAWYDRLMDLRHVGDYGTEHEVLPEEAQQALERAIRLVEAICELHPGVFELEVPKTEAT